MGFDQLLQWQGRPVGDPVDCLGKGVERGDTGSIKPGPQNKGKADQPGQQGNEGHNQAHGVLPLRLVVISWENGIWPRARRVRFRFDWWCLVRWGFGVGVNRGSGMWVIG